MLRGVNYVEFGFPLSYHPTYEKYNKYAYKQGTFVLSTCSYMNLQVCTEISRVNYYNYCSYIAIHNILCLCVTRELRVGGQFYVDIKQHGGLNF